MSLPDSLQEQVLRARREIAEGDLEAGAHALAEARSTAIDAGRREAASEIALELAQAEYGRRTPAGYESSRSWLKEVLSESAPAERVLRARAHHLLGVLELRSWNADGAARELDNAFRLLEHDGDPERLAHVYDSLGQLREFRGDRSGAVSAYSCSLALKVQVEDREGLAITLNNLGRLYCKLEEWTAAREILRARLQLAESLGDIVGRVVSGPLWSLATAHAGEVPRALEFLDRIEMEARQREMDLHLAYALKVRSELETRFGAAESAIATAREGVEIMERLDDRIGGGHLRRVLGEALEATHDFVAAHAELQEARLRLRDGDDIAEELAALEALGRVCRKQGRKSEALAAVDRGLFLAHKLGYGRRENRLAWEHDQLLLLPGDVDLELEILWDRSEAGSTIAVERERPGIRVSVVAELGRGSFGVVYQVRESLSRNEYALKQLIVDERSSDPRRLQRFRNEAFAVSRLRHPNIVEIYQIDTDPDSNQYLLMELLGGGSLERARLDWRRTFELGAQIADALAAVHAEGYVHRDLKPANILLRTDGTPVLTDFGVAHIPQRAQTLEGEILGSLPYLPPEAFQGEPAHSGWDAFAFGVTLYELIEGVRPYPTPLREEGLPRFPAGAVRAPRDGDLPAAAGDLLLSLIAEEPAKRPDAAAARDRLRSLLGSG